MAFWDLGVDVSALLGVSFKSDYLSIPCLRQRKEMFCLCLRDQVLFYSHSKGTVLDWKQLHVTSHLGSVVIFNEATPELPSLMVCMLPSSFCTVRWKHCMHPNVLPSAKM